MIYPIYPIIPPINDYPPKLYKLMQSMVNFGKDEKTSIYDLSKEARKIIFDFNYPLTNNINKEEFETMILNHFINRRIGFQTFTNFKIQLNVKLNTIMPRFNKLFDSLNGWDLFNDGIVETENSTDNRTTNNESNVNSESNTDSENIQDNRYSKLPQNELDNVIDGSYVSEINYNKSNSNSNDKSSVLGVNSGTDNNIHNSVKHISVNNRLEIFKEFQKNIDDIYSLIFKELDSLFFGLID